MLVTVKPDAHSAVIDLVAKAQISTQVLVYKASWNRGGVAAKQSSLLLSLCIL
ncbi:hypothetical protein CBM2625_U50025 [Cupriavidus taiwanensis]|uniref:Uncharacterized protein n=1 Tax=Cupriavidus taiwanensis TaxID=164546 RepID=A0A375HBD2_9BURK|nr:hypothetical protein CBM2625_U50025 [Cupriavidus taiwanensis]SPD49042.1 protein of unknown function [Cupriavidus taiwanensis]